MRRHSCPKAELCVCLFFCLDNTVVKLPHKHFLKGKVWETLWSLYCMIFWLCHSFSLFISCVCPSVTSSVFSVVSVIVCLSWSSFSGLGYCWVVLGSGPGCSCHLMLSPGSGGPRRWKCTSAGGEFVCVLWHDTVAPRGLPHWLDTVTCMWLCGKATANQRKAWV